MHGTAQVVCLVKACLEVITIPFKWNTCKLQIVQTYGLKENEKLSQILTLRNLHKCKHNFTDSKRFVFQDTSTMNVKILFHNVTKLWPVQYHLPSRALSWDTSTATVQSLSPYTDLKSSVTWEPWIMNVHRLFPNVTNEEPFEDHLLSRTLLTWTALSPSRCSVCQES